MTEINENGQEICARLTRGGAKCQNPVYDSYACVLHLTREEKDKLREAERRRIEESKQRQREQQLLERHDKIMRSLAAVVAEFAPFDEDEAKMAERTLSALLDSLHDI